MQGTPAPPAPPALPAPPGAPVIVTIPGANGPASATAIYQGLKAQREVLGNQLENLEDKRRDLSQRLQEVGDGADKKGLEQRITDVDARISSIDKQIAESDARVAQAAATPGAVQPDRPIPRQGPPDEVYVLAGMFIVIVLLPLSIALARRIWRRGVATITKLPAELTERLTRLEQGMDAVAVEVERIGEGQRFMARMFSEDGSLKAIGAGAAEPVEVKAREADGQYRR